MPEIVLLDAVEFDGGAIKFAVLNEAGARDPEEKTLASIQELATCLRNMLCTKQLIGAECAMTIFAKFGDTIYAVGDARQEHSNPQIIKLLHDMIDAASLDEPLMLADFSIKPDGARAVKFSASTDALPAIRALLARA